MNSYNLKSLQLPSLTGRPLRLFAAALDNPVGQKLLLGRLMRDGGIDTIRKLRLEEPPTLKPLVMSSAPAGLHSDPLERLNAAAECRPQTAKEIPYFSTFDYADAYRSGVVTPVDVAKRALDAIGRTDELEPPLRAFIACDSDDVMAQAEEATRRIQAEAPLSIFDGVPVVIKDEFDQVPYPTTVGTSFLGTVPVSEDSTVVARMSAAGALLLGKANMYEIGISPEGFNLHHGTARNPYNLDHDTGGSSSGSAVAVAAGFCPVAIGADGGGSIRVPAAHCGQVGLKATYGRVSEFGAAPLCWSVAHAGPIGATVADVALAYAAIAGLDPKDANCLQQPAVRLDDWSNPDLSGVRLGVYSPWFEHATESVVSGCKTMLDKLVAAGAQLVEINLPELDEMRVAHVVTILSEMASSMKCLDAVWRHFSPPVRINLAIGRSFSSHDYLQAQRMRTRALGIFDQAFSRVDAIMTPATAITAPPIPVNGPQSGWSNLNNVTEVMRYVFPGNLIGLPAISFPVGYDEAGLPIGMQAMGRHWEEHLLLRIAFAAEQVTTRRRPVVFYQLLG